MLPAMNAMNDEKVGLTFEKARGGERLMGQDESHPADPVGAALVTLMTGPAEGLAGAGCWEGSGNRIIP